MVHVMMMMSVSFKVFPRCHMDADIICMYIISYVFCSKLAFADDRCRKCEELEGQTLLRILLWYIFPHKLPKTVTVTTLLLFGLVTLLCGTFLFILVSEGPV